MPIDSRTLAKTISRRSVLGTAAALAATPAFADCAIGPAAHDKGPRVWMDLDQVELDAAYDQSVYAPLLRQIIKRYASNSEETRARLGAPKRLVYGPSAIEAMDLYPAKTSNAPIFVFVHGGAWRSGAAKDYAFPAELFVNAGCVYRKPYPHCLAQRIA
jgi:arylformamidase